MSSPSRRRSTDSSQSPLPSPYSPRTEYPFPNHDWSARPGPPTRQSTRRGSNASTVSFNSIGGSLDTASDRRRHSVAESGQNAISTLLQPPILRTGLLPHTAIHSTSHKPPTSRDIPPVTLTNIPHVESAAFRNYLSQVGGLFESFQRAKHEAESGGSQLFKREKSSAKDDEFEATVGRASRKSSISSVTTPKVDRGGFLSPLPESPTVRRRSSGGISRRGPPAPTPLSTIPAVYFDEHFHLENPRTFDIVSEKSEVVQQPRAFASDDAKGANGFANGSAPPARKALATNAILQEKLSWYMDTVEIHLIASISQASASFFAALGSLRELQAEAAESVTRIQVLRADLARLDKEMALGGLEVINSKKRHDNLQRLGEATEQLQYVVEGANQCEELVDAGDLETAIKRIAHVEQLACGIPRASGDDTSWLLPNQSLRLSDLRQLNALSGLSRGIDQLRLRIGKGFESRLLEVLLEDMRKHISSVPTEETLSRWTNASKRTRGGHSRGSSAPPAYMQTTQKLRDDLATALQGLGEARYLGQASATFREAIIKEMKTLIRKHLPSSTDDDAVSVASASTHASSRALTQQDKSSILARNLRALDAEGAEQLFVKTYCGIGEGLRRLGVQVKLLLDVTSGMKRPSDEILTFTKSSTSNSKSAPQDNGNLQEELSQALDMSSLLGQAVDKAQSEISKVLRVRTEQTIRLALPDFLRYFTVNRLFADECENVSGRSGAALKGVINNQIHDFVPLMLDAEKQKLAQTMESDKWEPSDFHPEDSAVLARIVRSMTDDPTAWIAYTDPSAVPDSNGNTANGTPAERNGVKEKTRPAYIDEERFILVESTAFALRAIERYCILITGIPSMVAEISTALLDYLKLFNSRTQQLILGAGATKTAGLSNINTKHLALASQSLSFFIALVPYLREFVRRRPSVTAASLAEYDRVKRLYFDHQSSIHEKLIDIMSSRATTHVKSMSRINFDEDHTRNLSQHVETLTKETSTLHRVLSKYLPDHSVAGIMKPVFTSYKEQMGEAFEEATVNTGEGKARLLRDAQQLSDRLGKIDGSDDLGEHLIGLVNAKQVPEKAKRGASSNEKEPPKGDTASEAKEETKDAG